MNPKGTKLSEQTLQMQMLGLEAKVDTVLSDGEMTDEDTIYNMIEVLTEEATLNRIRHFKPQLNMYTLETNLNTLLRGVYFGYFKDISIDEGTIRLLSW